MSYVYVANFCTIADVEAESDDAKHHFELENMAEPRVSAISTGMNIAWVKKLRRQIEAEWQHEMDDGVDKFEWETDTLIHSQTQQPNEWRHSMFAVEVDHLRREHVASLIIRRVELDN